MADAVCVPPHRRDAASGVPGVPAGRGHVRHAFSRLHCRVPANDCGASSHCHAGVRRYAVVAVSDPCKRIAVFAAAVARATACPMRGAEMVATDFAGVGIFRIRRYARLWGFAVIRAMDLPVFALIAAPGPAAWIGLDPLIQTSQARRAPRGDETRGQHGRGTRTALGRTWAGTIVTTCSSRKTINFLFEALPPTQLANDTHRTQIHRGRGA